jgi:hypothetical protein
VPLHEGVHPSQSHSSHISAKISLQTDDAHAREKYDPWRAFRAIARRSSSEPKS